MLPLSRFTLASAVLFTASLASWSVHAGTRYVSSSGFATTQCNAATPCGYLSVAIQIAAIGDTIVCLSTPPAENLEINKSLTIECSAARAQVRDFAAQSTPFTGIKINIAPNNPNDPSRTVRLRGITLDGSPNFYQRGIDIVDAAVVHIEDCVISNVREQGIYDHRTGGQTRLYVKDSFISGNGGPGISQVSQGTAITVLDNVRIENNRYGIVSATGSNIVINRSVFSGNSVAGIEADFGAQVEVVNSIISHNNVNVQAFGKVRLQENAIKFSNTAIQGSNAVSMGANRFSGNGAIGTTLTLATGAAADVFN